MIKKERHASKNTPYEKPTPLIVKLSFSRLDLLIKSEITGIIKDVINVCITRVNAAPTTMATPTSATFPREIKLIKPEPNKRPISPNTRCATQKISTVHAKSDN